MRKWFKAILITVLLAGGVIVCVIRWQAWFGMPEEPKWTGDSLSYQFPTFAADTVPGFIYTERGWQDIVKPSSLELLVLGDIHNKLLSADYNSLAARVPDAEVVVQVGDWLHRGQEYYHQLLMREWTNSALCGLPIIACPGNHEYSKGIHKALSPVWLSAFPQPDNGPAGVPGKHYYIDFPKLRLISIDTNPLTRIQYLTRTLTWLRTVMNGANGRYIVVIMHHPVYSAAKGRFNSLIYATFRCPLGEADLVLAGHDHSYMRKTPFVVLNTAGHGKPQRFHYTPDVTDSVPTYSVLSVNDSLCFKAYRMSDGVAIDSLYVKHN